MYSGEQAREHNLADIGSAVVAGRLPVAGIVVVVVRMDTLGLCSMGRKCTEAPHSLPCVCK